MRGSDCTVSRHLCGIAQILVVVMVITNCVSGRNSDGQNIHYANDA